MNVLFDLDDTLHDKTASLNAYACELWQRDAHHIDADRDIFVQRFIDENSIIQPKDKVFKTLSATFGIPPEITARLLKEFDTSFHQFATPFDTTTEVLEFLKSRDVKIACVTNGRDFFQRNKIAALGLEPYLDIVVTSGGFGTKKPDHSIFNQCLRLLGATHTNTCVCGDSLRADIVPANELGFTSIWKSSESSPIPDYTFNHFSEFYGIWEQIEG